MRFGFVAALVLLSVSHAPAAQEPLPRAISTTGEAVVNVVPDEVILGLGVETFAAKLEDAKKANDERAARLVKTIKAAGVEERYVQTDTLQLDIRYRSSHPSEGIEGYYARRAYSVTLPLKSTDRVSYPLASKLLVDTRPGQFGVARPVTLTILPRSMS